MSLVVQRESTVYIYVAVTGTAPSAGAEVALLPAGQRPLEADWETGVVVDDSDHELWFDAQGSGLEGDYYVALLIGSFGGNTVAPGQGDYQVWLRLTDVTEQPVMIAPVALEVA